MFARVRSKTLWLRRRSSPAITFLGPAGIGFIATGAGRPEGRPDRAGELAGFVDVTPSVSSFTIPHPKIQDRLPLTPLPNPNRPTVASPSRQRLLP